MTADRAALELRLLPAGDPASAGLLARYLELLHERIGPEFDFAAPAAAPSTAAQFEPGSGGRWVVAFEEGRPVACGGFRRLDDEACEVKRMYVADEARGRGHGRALLAELERLAREAGYRTVRLDTAAGLTESQGLYRSSGYEAVDRYNDNQWASHWFQKAL